LRLPGQPVSYLIGRHSRSPSSRFAPRPRPQSCKLGLSLVSQLPARAATWRVDRPELEHTTAYDDCNPARCCRYSLLQLHVWTRYQWKDRNTARSDLTTGSGRESATPHLTALRGALIPSTGSAPHSSKARAALLSLTVRLTACLTRASTSDSLRSRHTHFFSPGQ